MGLLLRESQEADLSFLRAMLYEAVFWRVDVDKPSFDEGLAYPDVGKSLAGWGARDGDIAVVAAMDSMQVGAGWVRFWTESNTIRGFVEEGTPVLVFGVHPDYRHRGIGTTMIDWLITYTSEHGVPRISLAVSKDNYALDLYRQQGFREVEDTGDSYLMVRESSTQASPAVSGGHSGAGA